MHREKSDPLSEQIGFSARQFARYTQRCSEFLDYKPSAVAASCILLAINLSRSEIGPQMGLDRYLDVVSYQPPETQSEGSSATSEPLPVALNYWSRSMKKVTKIEARKDLAHVYQSLVESLDKTTFKGKLRSDPNLWVTLPEAAAK